MTIVTFLAGNYIQQIVTQLVMFTCAAIPDHIQTLHGLGPGLYDVTGIHDDGCIRIKAPALFGDDGRLYTQA